ncbi:MAG: hypothetical protein LBL99_02745 [Holosporaceae bacterium]|jgi:hypothetical protein|nr:hypothetical protein [Holosporaceae bacterium]
MKSLLYITAACCIYAESISAAAPVAVAEHPVATVAAVETELGTRGILDRAAGIYQAMLANGINPADYLEQGRELNISIKTVADLIEIATDPTHPNGPRNTLTRDLLVGTPPTSQKHNRIYMALTAAADKLSERKRGEKDAKLEEVKEIYDGSHAVLQAFDAAVRLFTARTLDQVAQAGAELGATLTDVQNDLQTMQDHIDGAHGVRGLLNIGRANAVDEGAVGKKAQRLHTDLLHLKIIIKQAFDNLIGRAARNNELTDHETLAILALIYDTRNTDRRYREHPTFTKTDLARHIAEITEITPEQIDAAKENLNTSIRRLYAKSVDHRDIPVFFVAEGGTNRVDDYLIP